MHIKFGRIVINVKKNIKLLNLTLCAFLLKIRLNHGRVDVPAVFVIHSDFSKPKAFERVLKNKLNNSKTNYVLKKYLAEY